MKTETGQRKSTLMHLMAVGLVAAMSMVAGCAVFAVGAGASVGAGAVAYCGNEMRALKEVTVDRAWEAADVAMKDMGFTIIPAETHKDATGGTIQGRNARDQVVRVRLLRQAERITEVRVRVGYFATADNRIAEQLLFEKITKLIQR